MCTNPRILLKLSGQIFINQETGLPDIALVASIASQIKLLSEQYHFGIVIGGGNFFRGNQHGKAYGLSPWSAHTTGMLATVMNGVMLRDIMVQSGLDCILVSALDCPQIAQPINQYVITEAANKNSCIIFAGGTGNPYFTTDTNAVLRALQFGAKEIWKGTSIDGVYDQDPRTHKDAQRLQHISYTYALEHHIAIMDATAFALASEQSIVIRIFNIFEANALVRAAQDKTFGSSIQQ
jgi:uridylate kinase